MLTVLGATLVTTIPVLMRLQLGSYGYALPQTPKEPSFQPGSGALAPVTMVQPPQSQSPDDQQRKLTERGLPERDTIAVALAAVLAAVGASTVCLMMPAGGGGGHRETTHRVPPTWSPENDDAGKAGKPTGIGVKAQRGEPQGAAQVENLCYCGPIDGGHFARKSRGPRVV